ncbi:hypothetical protein FGO68_gene15612 [Halteria grandinella]|uniref:Uncharacterized protein n=1 Tax=Halteria grandinella TaxID=5974 RepID=A0A8J8NDM0_HALGN|nr:hypothetical protein FGO68_gene15612 [Halteria grandinella]
MVSFRESSKVICCPILYLPPVLSSWCLVIGVAKFCLFLITQSIIMKTFLRAKVDLSQSFGPFNQCVII